MNSHPKLRRICSALCVAAGIAAAIVFQQAALRFRGRQDAARAKLRAERKQYHKAHTLKEIRND